MPGTLLSTGTITVNKRVKVSALTKFVFYSDSVVLSYTAVTDGYDTVGSE